MNPEWISAGATIVAALIAAATSVLIQWRGTRQPTGAVAETTAAQPGPTRTPAAPAGGGSRRRTAVVAAVAALITAAAAFPLARLWQGGGQQPDVWLADTSCVYTRGVAADEYVLVVRFKLGTTGAVDVADFGPGRLAAVVGDGPYLQTVAWANGRAGDFHTASAIFHSDAAGRSLVVTARVDPDHRIAESNEGNNDVRLRLQLPRDLVAGQSGSAALCA